VLSLAILFRHVVLRDPGKFVGCMYPVPSPMTLAFDQRRRSRPFQIPHPPILVGACFRGLTTVRFRYDLSICSPSCRSWPGLHPADEDFYVRASDGLVTRSAAGYDYRGNWASSPAGLSPARMPTSIACNSSSKLFRTRCAFLSLVWRTKGAKLR
jgi:hypothetical protein